MKIYRSQVWAKGWALIGSERHQLLRHQQQRKGGMICADIIEYRLVGHVEVPDVGKVTSASYCNIQKRLLVP